MKKKFETPIVTTVKEKCKICYTCVRECPARAIGISEGQAQIIDDKCIHCGNCIKVCGRDAKVYQTEIKKLDRLLKSNEKVVAMIAPSFPAEFIDVKYKRVVGAIYRLGFERVTEVAFGADVIAKEYMKLLNRDDNKSWIATTCPSIVYYIEKYQEELIPHLVPLVSPMVAMARIIRKYYGQDVKVVFIGPCTAKKHEARSTDDEIDASITFKELKEYLLNREIDWKWSGGREFDPPHANLGGLFAISGGLLQTAGIKEDLLLGDIIRADGKVNFIEALKEFKKGELRPKLLETLSCEGCIMGPGYETKAPAYKKRNEVSRYIRSRRKNFDLKRWVDDMNFIKDIDLAASFEADNQRVPKPEESIIRSTLSKLGKSTTKDELNCGACGYDTCREHAIAILSGVAESEMCLPYTIERLKTSVKELEFSYDELKNVKQILNHREKLASMGQLSAGIAHEVNNPLGVVLMYAHILLEQYGQDNEMTKDLEMIVSQANRCKKIVSGLLNFSRQNKVIYESINIYDLACHCSDSIHPHEKVNVWVKTIYQNPYAEVDKDQISQVIINLINNSLDALEDNPGNITVEIGGNEKELVIKVKDDGPGIPEKIKKHIFDPFFTTKQIGKGTGLGLPVCYGIVKMHRGNIVVNSNVEEGKSGTEVIVQIPRYENNQIRRTENVRNKEEYINS